MEDGVKDKNFNMSTQLHVLLLQQPAWVLIKVERPCCDSTIVGEVIIASGAGGKLDNDEKVGDEQADQLSYMYSTIFNNNIFL